jgi:hypothetical protein
MFLVRIKAIRTKNMVMDKNKNSAGFYPRSLIAHGWVFHPCAINDPRGRFSSAQQAQLCNNEGAI